MSFQTNYSLNYTSITIDSSNVECKECKGKNSFFIICDDKGKVKEIKPKTAGNYDLLSKDARDLEDDNFNRYLINKCEGCSECKISECENCKNFKRKIKEEVKKYVNK